jgi:hypothetical protein
MLPLFFGLRGGVPYAVAGPASAISNRRCFDALSRPWNRQLLFSVLLTSLMDPVTAVGVVASILTILQPLRDLLTLASKVAAAPEQAEQLRKEYQELAELQLVVDRILDPQPDLKAHVRAFQKKLWELESQTLPHQARGWNRLAWTSKRRARKQIMAEIERCKSSLNIALQVNTAYLPTCLLLTAVRRELNKILEEIQRLGSGSSFAESQSGEQIITDDTEKLRGTHIDSSLTHRIPRSFVRCHYRVRRNAINACGLQNGCGCTRYTLSRANYRLGFQASEQASKNQTGSNLPHDEICSSARTSKVLGFSDFG